MTKSGKRKEIVTKYDKRRKSKKRAGKVKLGQVDISTQTSSGPQKVIFYVGFGKTRNIVTMSTFGKFNKF